MKSLHRSIIVVLLGLCLTLAVSLFSKASAERPGMKKGLELFGSVAGLVEDSYVEEVQTSRLIGGGISGMMKTLDPYSQYLDPKAYEELESETKGEFGGLGLEVSVKGGFLHVISPLDDSPAARAGIRPGDRILRIDGVVTKDITLGEAVRKMRGKPGQVVVLSIVREGSSEVQDISVPREVVKVKGVREAKMLDGQIGYIRISEFQKQTGEDFVKALTGLQAQGMRGLIIDVRNNPGGLLTSAVDVASNFIKKGELIVSTRGRLPKKNVRYLSTHTDPVTIHPMALLVNKGSASGSEILAGAFQDYKLATVVGTKTYGKGCVQTLTPLTDGSAVRITTSRYYTPQGRLIHEIGIQPDVIVAEDNKDGKDQPLEKALELLRTQSGGEALVP